MNSSSLQNKQKIAISAAVAATLAVGAGCSTSRHQTAYNDYTVPVVNRGNAAEVYETSPSMGATGNEYGAQVGQSTQSTQWSQQQSTAAASQGGETVIPLEREQMQVGKQEVNEGGVRVRKYVTTRTISQPVQIRQETVTVDRVPAAAAQAQNNTGNMALNQPFQGGEITIPLVKEQPVVQTQVVPNGAVVIRRQDTTQSVNVQGQVRSEHVAAEPIGNPQNVNISSNLRSEDGQFQGAAPSAYGQSSGAGGSQTITQWSQLSAAPDATALAGSQVNLSNVKIQKVVSEHLITVAADNGMTYYVRIDQPAGRLHAGETVNLNGTIRQVPSDPSSMGWGHETSRALQGQQIVIEVPSVSPQNR
jgi:uncharacterized protein (TIGR02271 family)